MSIKLPSISFWEQQWLKKADTIVIGSGIVGLQCAIRIKRKDPSKEVWVLDRAPVALGASMRNAGFACFGSMGEILDDVKRTDEDTALGLYRKRFQGLKLLLEEFGTTTIGYEKTGGYEIFEIEREGELDEISMQLDHVNEQLRDVTGEMPFQPKSTQALGMKVLNTGIYTPLEGALQSHLLYKTIWNAATATGVKIYGGVQVLPPQIQDDGKWQIPTKEGYTFSGRNVVVCTNGYARDILPELEVEPARGQVLVTSSIPDLPWRGLMHADKGYIYFRSLGTRILIGGARNTNFKAENTKDIACTEDIVGRLKEYLEQIVVPGKSFEITHQWAGTMGMNEDRTPIVKQIEPGLFVCVRMGGMGVALSALVSRELADLVYSQS